ncbi:MAG: DUF4184 family protein [Bacteroidota bacterium]|nr:DUF4184 family protein [Bacteroidota bacterium]
MPFTLAHPAAVLPFGALTKRWLSVTGMVMGSLAPDFEYFFRMKLLSRYSHTWEGMIWFDLPVAFVLVIIYELFIKDKLISHLPAAANRRLYWFRGYRYVFSGWYLIAIVISILIGAASHIAWDGFTHPKGMFVQQFAILNQIVDVYGHRVYVFHLLQYASGLAGAIIIAITYYAQPKGELTKAGSIAAFWLQVILVTAVTVAIKLATGLPLHQYANMLVTVMDGAMIGIVVASVLAG